MEIRHDCFEMHVAEVVCYDNELIGVCCQLIINSINSKMVCVLTLKIQILESSVCQRYAWMYSS